jgi:hypothetical protein
MWRGLHKPRTLRVQVSAQQFQQGIESLVLRNRGRNYGMFIPGDDDWNARMNDAETTTLAMILSGGLKEFGYVYDFGDSWEHRIIVENVKPAEQQTSYPEFLGGERRCPPEDCGGIPGYYDFLDKITAKQLKKRKAALDWYGGPYDPDDIDEQQIVINLQSIK